MINDYLLVDVSKPVESWSNPKTYLEIESAHFNGQKPKSCGGRCPNEDCLDRTLTLLISGPRPDAEKKGDGVNSPAPATKTFPYLLPSLAVAAP